MEEMKQAKYKPGEKRFSSGRVARNCKNDFDEFERCYLSNKFGRVYTWGSGEMGQLGHPQGLVNTLPKDREGFPFQPFPLRVHQLKDARIVEVSAGEALDIYGRVYSWGASACGQLGISSIKDLPTDLEGFPYQPIPTLVESLAKVCIVQIATGDAHCVARSADGKLYSWGGGGCGQLGHPDTHLMPKDEDGCAYLPIPLQIDLLKDFCIKEVAAGKAHTVAIVEGTGQVYSWGAAASGQLGHPDTHTFQTDEDGYNYQPAPKLILAIKDISFAKAACGDVNTLLLSSKGEVYSFGGGSFGQLGLGALTSMPLDPDGAPYMPTPKKIESFAGETIISIDCGDAHSMALTSKGKLYGWGAAACGQLGIDHGKPLPKDSEGSPYQPIPSIVSALSKKIVVAVSCGEAHTLALDDNGIIYSFGANGCGQLGQDIPARYDEPTSAKTPAQKTDKFRASEAPRTVDNRRSPVEDNPHLTINLQFLRSNRRNTNTAFELYPMFKEELSITHFYPTPNMIRSLLPTSVLRIASGGVHNLAIVEGNTNSLPVAIYCKFMTASHTDFTFIVEGVYVRVHRVILAYKSGYFANFFATNKDLKEIELKDTKYKAFRMIMDFIYLSDFTLLDIEGFDKELIEVYKLAKKYGIVSLQEEIRKRLHVKLKQISIDDTKDLSGKKKYKAMNVIESVTEVAKKYEAIINEASTEEHKLVMLPNGSALLIDAKKYKALLEEGIQLALPEQPSSQRIFFPKNL